MLNWQKNLWTLSIAVLLSGSSYTMVIPFLPLYLLDIGVSPASVNMWSGIIFSATFLVAGVMAPYWGRYADRTGKRRMVMRAGFSLAIVYFLGAFVRSPLELLIVRVLQGFANGFVPASMAIVTSSTPKDKMGFSMGFMQTALVSGGILGPLLGGTLSHLFGMRLSFVIAAGIIFLATLAVGYFVTEPPSAQVSKDGGILEDVKMAFQNRKLRNMLLLLFTVQMVTMTLQPLIALYVAELQGSMEGVALTAGIVYSLAGIAGAIAAPTWGKVGQTRGFMKILAAAFFGAGCFNFGQFFACNIYQFSVLQFLFGLFIVGVFPAINTIAVTGIETNFQGRIFGLMTTANQLGSMVGPLVGGFMSSWIGIKPVFLFTSTMLFLLGLRVIFSRAKK
ncbi:DHA1 family multidrug resistance protein-like MFS transporter [Sporomusaceae bacterium BoRhaA]|uniref:MFS transporter n=1 Tax=Pelorhabdus rhamnosifermentans TaxID=2772457 RepID=UPI001FE4066E|nr:MFS transporter [Pelorhabdus rhamnosifermentans]MBU2702600.1 DHA1 family multidrug resistance protein-like MFS transporter [Pelorhabdus rhamnosifermentans]